MSTRVEKGPSQTREVFKLRLGFGLLRSWPWKTEARWMKERGLDQHETCITWQLTAWVSDTRRYVFWICIDSQERPKLVLKKSILLIYLTRSTMNLSRGKLQPSVDNFFDSSYQSAIKAVGSSRIWSPRTCALWRIERWTSPDVYAGTSDSGRPFLWTWKSAAN